MGLIKVSSLIFILRMSQDTYRNPTFIKTPRRSPAESPVYQMRLPIPSVLIVTDKNVKILLCPLLCVSQVHSNSDVSGHSSSSVGYMDRDVLLL